jgi:hypothetical protein
MNVTAKKDGPVWVVRVEDAGDCEPVQEYADRLLPVAFALAEKTHGPAIVDALACQSTHKGEVAA